MARYLIIGAGLSGLSVGSSLSRRGHDVVVVEKEKGVGGLCRSFSLDGCTFDYGPHFLFGPKAPPLLHELAPGLSLTRLPGTRERMFFRGKYHQFPFQAKDLLLKMGPLRASRALFELWWRRARSRPTPLEGSENVPDWISRCGARRVYEYTYLGEYVRKLYGLPPEQVDGDWGIQKLKFLSQWQHLGFLQLAGKALKTKEQAARRVIHYPATSIEALPHAVAESLMQTGGQVLLEHEALHVEASEQLVTLTARTPESEKVLTGDFLISTLPLNALLAILHPPASAPLRERAQSLRCRCLLLLALVVEKTSILEDKAIVYFTEPAVPFRRITEFKGLNPSMAPSDRSSLCLEYTCLETDPIYAEDEEAILRRWIGPLEGLGIIREGDIRSHGLLRIPVAYPVYHIGYREALAEVFDYLASVPRCLSTGRQGMFHYNAMNNCILQGSSLAEKLSDCGHEVGGTAGAVARQAYADRLERLRS